MSYGLIRKAEISLSAEKFSMDEFTDSTGAKNYLGFSKIVPSVKLIFKNKNATSAVKKWLQWKTYFIRETALSFQRDTVLQQDVITYPKSNSYLNQLNFALENNRALYPYYSNVVVTADKQFFKIFIRRKIFFQLSKRWRDKCAIFCRKIYVFRRQNNL